MAQPAQVVSMSKSGRSAFYRTAALVPPGVLSDVTVMELTTDILRELQACRTDPGGPGERRGRPRVGARLVAKISTPGREALRAEVRVRDVSAGGIAFLYPRPMKLGSEFLLHVPASRDHVERVPCRVTRCERVSSDLFRIGASSGDASN